MHTPDRRPGLRRRTALGALGASLALPARAASKLTLGYTATLGFMGAFVAKDRGFFAQRGLDIDLLLITLNSNIPGALMGGSVQFGGPTPTVLLQANDGGLDLVVVSGCAGLDAANIKEGLFARAGAGIAKPADLIGRKVGVPGLNAYFHVLVRKWMSDHGADWRRVNFVEVAFTQSADVLRSGSVDAIATGEPFSTRIVGDGIGTLVVHSGDIAPAGTPSIFFAATRDWAEANRAAALGFRAAIDDAIRFAAADPGAARQSAAKFIRLPPEVIASVSMPLLESSVTPAQVQFWVDVMAQQDMIQTKPDPAALLMK